MLYLIALGNPGEEYSSSRHNVGWYMADKVRQHFQLTDLVFGARYQGHFSTGLIAGCEVTLLYPDTYMNHSGVAVRKLVPPQNYKDMIVLQDEIALPLGQIRLSTGRGDGGHNGIKSILETLGTKEFTRLRIGIAPTSFFTGTIKKITGDKMAKFVLGKFTKRESLVLEKVAPKVCEVLEVLIKGGVGVAMNRYNTH